MVRVRVRVRVGVRVRLRVSTLAGGPPVMAMVAWVVAAREAAGMAVEERGAAERGEAER